MMPDWRYADVDYLLEPAEFTAKRSNVSSFLDNIFYQYRTGASRNPTVQSLPHHIVLAQVQLLQARKFKRGQPTQAILNRFHRLSLDFLILNPDPSIVAAVELDDATHARKASLRADARNDHALKSADVPLIRWSAKSLPDRAAILAALPSVATGVRGNS